MATLTAKKTGLGSASPTEMATEQSRDPHSAKQRATEKATRLEPTTAPEREKTRARRSGPLTGLQRATPRDLR